MAKKATTKKAAAKKPVAKKSTVKSKKSLPVGVIYEKYKFFYCLFALTTIIFAGLAVWLFIFSSEILNKYESIEACARTHGATCEIHVSGDAEEEAVKQD